MDENWSPIPMEDIDTGHRPILETELNDEFKDKSIQVIYYKLKSLSGYTLNNWNNLIKSKSFRMKWKGMDLVITQSDNDEPRFKPFIVQLNGCTLTIPTDIKQGIQEGFESTMKQQILFDYYKQLQNYIIKKLNYVSPKSI